MRSTGWLTVLLLVLAGCASRPALTARANTDPGGGGSDEWPRTIRVGLVVSVAEARFEAPSGVRWIDPEQTVEAEPGVWTVAVRDGRLLARRGDTVLISASREVVLRAPSAGRWKVKGDVFAGDLVLRRNDDDSVSLINRVGLETYLRGVVPWEIGRPEDAALEAVKAQAVAARTYTYAHLDHWPQLGFDLYADTRDQVYRGLTGTADITDRAVRETAHRVLTYRGNLVRAYYSSNNGGFGSTLTDVWTRDGAPYLVGRRDADIRGRSWSRDSRHFRWSEAWSARELGDIIRANLPAELKRSLSPWDIGRLQRLEIVSRDRSGRVQRLRIVTDTDEFELWGDRIRWVLRPAEGHIQILRSTMFEVEHVTENGRLVAVVIRGGGFGHGVGMCQTGALARARAGQSAEKILKAYYEGARIVDVRGLSRAAVAR